MAPSRTTGLPYHLGYPIVSCIFLAIAAFSSADSVWYVSVTTSSEVIRFASQNYCGYTVSNLVITEKMGCIFRGFQWQIPVGYFGFTIPNDINLNLGRVAVTSVVAFCLVIASGLIHAYSIRYSYQVDPEPNKDKLYSLVQIHLLTVSVCFIFTWVAFIAQAAIVGHAISQSNNLITQGGVEVSWGQSVWLVLASAFVHFGWGYEAVRWRAILLA
ncbi:hypothetical protein CI109_101916 [Kwoniella shandongensis]|uniref:Uncharacterized protein n=1 Tax=Kwoniella shandongensis TaxID=1734106 RepID=A0A5M6BW20_9TREE|nr:uncharacterized protein CI109_005424 [Kwoniella shandongensis]KAA5526300.1 hypothetical protein CI109_005424 [Kwoniella shandongensis]